MDDAAQAFLKTKIMDNIHKYFYLICFAAYLREAAILCKDNASDDDKKNFSLTGGKVSTPADQLKLAKTFVQYKDLPQGDHKKRAKYRFASKTLMRVLPSGLKAEVEGLIANQTMTLDLYEILGQCTWGQAKA